MLGVESQELLFVRGAEGRAEGRADRGADKGGGGADRGADGPRGRPIGEGRYGGPRADIGHYLTLFQICPTLFDTNCHYSKLILHYLTLFQIYFTLFHISESNY